MGAKGCKGRGGAPRAKEWCGRRHGGGGGGKNKRRRRSAAAIEKAYETLERRQAKREIKSQLKDIE